MRRFGLFVLTVASLLMLSGCHGAKEMNQYEVPEEFDTSKPIEITFWAKNDTNKNQVDVYQKAIKGFSDLYPNVTVNIRLYTDYGRIYNDVITNIATNTTPNVCITYPDHIATYLTGNNQVVALEDLMADERYGLGGSEVAFDAPTKEEIIPEYLSECEFGGHTYAMPFMRSTEACYVNKDIVERLGFELPEVLTWDFIWEVSEAAMEKNADGTFKINGQNIMIPFIYKSTDNMMIQMLKQQDAGYSTDEAEILLFNDTTRANLEEIAVHAKSGAFSTFKISSYPSNFLNAGQCIFAVDSTAGSTWMGTDAPLSDISEDKIIEFETAVYPVPQFNPDKLTMISQGPSVCIFNKDNPNEVLASWLFVQYLLSNDIQVGYSQTEGYVPVTSKARECESYQDYLSEANEPDDLHYPVKLEATKLLLNNASNTFVTPVFNGSASVRDAAGALIENTVKSVRRKQTIDDAYFEKLFADTTSLYRLDQLQGQNSGSRDSASDLGPLPKESVILIVVLVLAWVGIAIVFVMNYKKQKVLNK